MDPARLSGRLPLPPADEPTEEFARVTGRRQGFRAACAGVLTAALVLLALALLVALFASLAMGMPGPHPVMIGAHVAAAVAGVLLYRWSRRGPAFLGLVAILALSLWFFWWA